MSGNENVTGASMEKDAKTLVRRRWVRVLLCCVGAVILIVAFTTGGLDNSYVNYPRTPDPSVGRIVPYEVKGIVVYITEEQRVLRQWLGWIENLGLGLALLCVIYSRFRARSS